MLKKLIIIENGKEYQFETLEDIVKELLGEDFYSMTQSQKMKRMRMRASANCLNGRMEIVEEVPINGNVDGKFVIKNEITYILSLVTTNKIVLLERKDSDIFTKSIDKDNMKDNYIIVNTFAKELLAL